MTEGVFDLFTGKEHDPNRPLTPQEISAMAQEFADLINPTV